MHKFCQTQLGVSCYLSILWLSNQFNAQIFVIVKNLNTGMPSLRWWYNICLPIFITLRNTGCTSTWNPKNCINTFTKFWINTIIIIQNNIIPSSGFELFCSNLTPRKLPIIPSNVDSFLFKIFLSWMWY